MADEQENVKLTFDTNAKQAAGDVNKLAVTIDSTTDATKDNNAAVKAGSNDYKSFKTQLREANQELQKNIQLYGETSAETVKAAKAVANLKDQMGFAKDISDSFNPDQKFKALGAATQLAGTGLQGVTSGMALFGDQSEDTEKMLLKVQAAMSFSDALSNLSNLGDQWDIFKSVVQNAYARIVAARQADIAATTEQTIAQRILNATMLLNPYVAIGAAIAAVTIGVYAWVKATNEEAKALQVATDFVSKNAAETDNLALSIEETSKATEGYNTLEVARAKALGATDEQIQKIIQSQKELAVSTAFAFNKESWNNLLKATEAVRVAMQAGDEDLIKKAQENQDAARDIYQKSNDDFNKSIISEAENRFNVQADILQKQKEAAEKAAEERRKREEEAYKTEQELIRMRGEQARAAYEQEIKDFSDFRSKLIDAKIQGEVDEAERLAEVLEGITEEQDRVFLENVEKQKQIDEYKLELKQIVAEKEISIAEMGVNLIKNIFSKSKDVQKGALIAEGAVNVAKTVQNTFTGNAAALAQGIVQAGPIIGPGLAAPAIALNSVQGALSVAGTVAATAKGLQALGGGSGQSATTGRTSAGTISAPSVAFNNTAENQIGQNVAAQQAAMPPIKVFVTESDMTEAQGNVKALVETNTF